MERKIESFEVEYIGIDSPSYFTGRGTACTEWDHVSIGIGDGAYDALQDALEQLAMSGWEVEDKAMASELERALRDTDSVQDRRDNGMDVEDDQYYVAVYVK